MLKELNSLYSNLKKAGLYSESTYIKDMMVKISEKKDKCPKATQDIDLNLKNRQKAIDKYIYGPMNPNLDNESPEKNNDSFWKKLSKIWSGKSDVEIKTSQAKTMRCKNCAAFDVSSDMKKCIKDGIEAGEKSKNSWDTVNAGQLGYCNFLDFKCASNRTCKAWVSKQQ